ncbi:MAG: IPT/TIG domain-containing protein [Spirochaetaceae bacterium]|jgi:hypothetical protein|nr:IPT/TIG domain-containing protein [Spirochaetaceae bacterium]
MFIKVYQISRRPFFTVLTAFSILTLTFSCINKTPQIISLDPRIGVTGDELHITGKNFGDEQNESFVNFGGINPTLSSYRTWSDKLIVVRIPDFAESCMITVQRSGSQSNPMLFSTLDAIPEILPDSIDYPVISNISPNQTSIGAVIEISGSGFGDNSDSSSVYFTWNVEKAFQINTGDMMTPARDYQGAYEAWNDRIIKVRVPDGAASGPVRVVTARGKSNDFPVTIAGNPGEKIIMEKKTYSISYDVNIRVEDSSAPNFLFLWLPVPATTASQLNKGILERNTKAFVENYRGAALYKFTDLPKNFSKKISVSYLVDVYAVETNIQPHLIRTMPNNFMEKAYIEPSFFVNSDDSRIVSEAKDITASETNPYLKARAIYRAMLKETGGGTRQDALKFCALCRAAGISAVPIAGVLINTKRQPTVHVWNEFWLEGFGWVPVDIVLGKGNAPPDFYLHENNADYYFGNIDNNRIVFSNGETQLSQMNTEGKTLSHEQSYALQNIWEESSENIRSYSSYWSEISITGVY